MYLDHFSNLLNDPNSAMAPPAEPVTLAPPAEPETSEGRGLMPWVLGAAAVVAVVVLLTRRDPPGAAAS